MNKYHRWYENLMNKARHRPCPEGYTEKHHILPKCMKGTDDLSNIVYLTAREHFLAHVFLAKMNLSKKHHIQMLHAFHAMSTKYTQNPNQRAYDSKRYEYLKKELVSHFSALWSGDSNPTKKLKGEAKEKWKEKLKIAQIKKMSDPHFYDKYKKAQKEAVIKPENRKVVSERTKEAMARPDVRERYLNGLKNRKVDKESHKNKTKEAMARPEVKEKRKKYDQAEKYWYTDGIKNAIIIVGQEVPEGWHRGMTRIKR